jgi:predicted O-methyltransferase YrrM
MNPTKLKEAVGARAPLLATAVWWYWTLRRQTHFMKRAAKDGRSYQDLLAAFPPGATILRFPDLRLADPRMTVAPVTAIQRREEALDLLDRVTALAPQRVCEIGTSAAGTLFLLTRAAPPGATIVSIDIVTPHHLRFARAKLARHGQSVVSLEGDSQDPVMVERLRNALGREPLDFLLIDGDHSYAGVKRDFELYASLVRPGGLIALHDILPDSGDPAGPISGEVPRFWAELRGAHDTEELVHGAPGQGLGIGLVRV